MAKRTADPNRWRTSLEGVIQSGVLSDSTASALRALLDHHQKSDQREQGVIEWAFTTGMNVRYGQWKQILKKGHASATRGRKTANTMRGRGNRQSIIDFFNQPHMKPADIDTRIEAARKKFKGATLETLQRYERAARNGRVDVGTD